jgi:hypothetical protein
MCGRLRGVGEGPKNTQKGRTGTARWLDRRTGPEEKGGYCNYPRQPSNLPHLSLATSNWRMWCDGCPRKVIPSKPLATVERRHEKEKHRPTPGRKKVAGGCNGAPARGNVTRHCAFLCTTLTLTHTMSIDKHFLSTGERIFQDDPLKRTSNRQKPTKV